MSNAAVGWAQSLTLQRSIALPGVSGRIDHLALDRQGHRMFIAALGNDSVEVVDLASAQRVKSIPGFDEPQGLAYVPEANRLYVANGGDGSVRLLDGTSFAPQAVITLGEDADNVRYDSAAHRVYVGYGDGAIAAIDVATNRVTGRIQLPGHPESFQLEELGARLFVNVPQGHQLWVLDRIAEKPVVARSLLFARGNFPLAFDESHHRLFVGCRSPARLVVVSTDSSYEISRTDLHGDCDDLFYDAPRKRLYASCGAGYLDVFEAAPGQDPTRIESVATTAGARTSFFDGAHIYLAVPKRGGRAAEVREYGLR